MNQSTQTSPLKSKKFRYTGDINPEEEYSPNTRKRALLMMTTEIKELRKENKKIKRKISIQDKLVTGLQDSLVKLKNCGEISLDTSQKLNVSHVFFFQFKI